MRRFVIKKYVVANTAKEAIERESSQAVDEVFVDTESPQQLSSAIGFKTKLEPRWRSDEAR
jgi:hypothetical protein